MASFKCSCGEVLRFTTGDEPHDLRLYPNAVIGQGLADITVEEIAEQPKYVSEGTPSLPPIRQPGRSWICDPEQALGCRAKRYYLSGV
jgi:hypothetical protein